MLRYYKQGLKAPVLGRNNVPVEIITPTLLICTIRIQVMCAVYVMCLICSQCFSSALTKGLGLLKDGIKYK